MPFRLQYLFMVVWERHPYFMAYNNPHMWVEFHPPKNPKQPTLTNKILNHNPTKLNRYLFHVNNRFLIGLSVPYWILVPLKTKIPTKQLPWKKAPDWGKSCLAPYPKTIQSSWLTFWERFHGTKILCVSQVMKSHPNEKSKTMTIDGYRPQWLSETMTTDAEGTTTPPTPPPPQKKTTHTHTQIRLPTKTPKPASVSSPKLASVHDPPRSTESDVPAKWKWLAGKPTTNEDVSSAISKIWWFSHGHVSFWKGAFKDVARKKKGRPLLY